MPEPVALIASIDTEEDNWHPARSGITTANIAELPRLQRHLDGLGLRATYFTTYQVARDPRASRTIRELHDGGRAEIAAHVHPWNTPPLSEEFIPRHTMLSNLPRELQVEKIRAVTTALEEVTGTRPYAFRAGRWGFGTKTAGALLECGYRVDSSVTPFKSWAAYDEGPRHEGAPLGIYRLDGRGDTRVPIADGKLVEVPLSWGYSRRLGLWGTLGGALDRSSRNRLRWARLAARLHLIAQIELSPEAESVSDMLILSRNLVELGVRHLHLSWHSPSLMPGLSPFARTRADVERLYAAIARYVEGLAAITDFTSRTVSEAAAELAPPFPRDAVAVQPDPAAGEGRRLLVVSYHFPPDPAIGGQRWAGLTKYLRAWRWRSWVITAAPPAPAAGGVTVLSYPRRRTLNDLWRALRSPRDASGASGAAPAGGPAAGDDKPSWWSGLRRDAAVLLGWPDEGRGWILRAAWQTRRALDRLQADVLVSSGPPHSAHLAAWLARRGRAVRWIVDLRDPWAGPITRAWLDHPRAQSRMARWLAGRLERMVIAAADTVLCNTRQLAEALHAQYPRGRFAWLPNGVDLAQLPPRPAPRRQGLAIAHVGTIYGGRDLTTMLRALRAFLDAHPDARSDGTRLRIAGHVEPAPAGALAHEIAALRLASHVELLGVLPRPEALDVVARSGLALVLAQQQEFQVPAKLYELVGLGVPTVVVAEPHSAAGSEAERLGAWRVDAHDVAGLTEILTAAWHGQDTPMSSAGRVDYAAIAADADAILRGTSQGHDGEVSRVAPVLEVGVNALHHP